MHERLDDEVIVIDLEHGMYYALVGTAAAFAVALILATDLTD